jgi:ABC-type transporter Mla subunit MlaD
MHSEIPPYVFDILSIASAIGVLIQAFVLLALFIVFRRLQAKFEKAIGPAMDHAAPLIASTKQTVEELTPKLKLIAANLVEVSETLKQESYNVKASVDDVLIKTRAQTARVDEIVSGTLDGLSAAASHIQGGVSVPLRHVNGVLNGIRAGFGVLRNKTPRPADAQVVETMAPETVVVVEEIISGRPIS